MSSTGICTLRAAISYVWKKPALEGFQRQDMLGMLKCSRELKNLQQQRRYGIAELEIRGKAAQ